MQLEAHHGGGAHLDRGDADLAVALGEMAVAGREQRALLEHRQKQLRPLGQLLHVEIAAVLARRQRAQPGEAAGPGRHRAVGVGRQRHAAALDHPLLARGPGRELLRRWARRPETPMNGAPGMRTPGICAEVAQPSAIRQCTRNGSVITSRRKPEARHDRAERGRLRDDVGELDFEDVAGLRALDEHRPGQRMHRAGVERGEVGDGGRRGDLAVERVAGFERDLLALADLDGRRDVGMVAVVAAVRLVGERLVAVDMDRAHGGPSLIERQHRARDLARLHRAEGFVDVAEAAASVTIASRSSRPWR